MNIVRAFFLMALLTAPVMVSATCWKLAEHTYGVEARLLHAIAMTESGMNVNAKNINADGSYDIGLMQVNSYHFKRLKKMGVSESMLSENPCISLMVGASILRGMIDVYGYNWEAVGAYNAGTGKNRKALRMKYAGKVMHFYQQNRMKFP